jgi:TatD DNase family protein
MQKRVFQRVLVCCAEAGGRILSVHSVRAQTAVLDLVASFLPLDRGRVVLHWFTGDRSQARRAVDLGCYFSVNAEMMNTERGRAVVAALPPERLLTETDGPFTRVDQRSTRPADVSRVVASLAQSRGLEIDAAGELVRTNLKHLLSDVGLPDLTTATSKLNGGEI